MKIVECVPNISEGRDRAKIDAVTSVIEKVKGVKLLDVDPGEATNRTVITFIGSPDGVAEAAFQVVKKAAEVIDMSTHKGAHPRMGATDVCPFVPVSGVTMEDCAEIARKVGARIGEELGIPVYLYEEAASKPEWKNLANVRKGEYEGLAERFKDDTWKPDFGPASFNPTAGATAVGAREFLVAYNINLSTRDRKVAHDIALDIREAGRAKRDKQGNIVRDEAGKAINKPGIFTHVKAVGWTIEEYGRAQISINFTNYKITPIHKVFDECCKQAEKRGARVTGSELVGLIPKQAMLDAGRYYLNKMGKSIGVPESELIHIAVLSLGLDDLYPFKLEEKIVEAFVEKEGWLEGMKIADYFDELSTDSPAPGGGSVAAVSGAQAAALVSMVANLTHGKKGYEDAWEDMEKVAIEAQKLKDELAKSIDRDTNAFNALMAANRMPKKTDEQKAERERAIQEATLGAIEVPLSVVRNMIKVMELAKIAAEKGNRNSISDVSTAAAQARAAAEAAADNVMINVPGLADRKKAKALLEESTKLLAEICKAADKVTAEVHKVLEGNLK
ncbi:MAG: glutamate formimidoyltransferase [Candidatus Stahlbacteria bacterium]|nr:MAG: glutamate formimidoyltransferase [Candidatus Stahlbacteria bacterium]